MASTHRTATFCAARPLLALALVAGGVVAPGVPAHAAGATPGCDLAAAAGTPADPYLVASQGDLAEIDDCGLDKSYRQTASFAISGAWDPIGDLANHFSGVYDGDGFTVTFSTVSISTGGAGIFDFVAGATIRDLTIAGSLENTAANGSTGAVASQVTGTTADTLLVEDVTVTASITGSSITGGILGLAKQNNATPPGITLRRIVVEGDVSGKYATGGIFGSVRSEAFLIDDSEVSGTVTSTVAHSASAEAAMGGFIGEYGSIGTIQDSLFLGSIVAEASLVGGFVGTFREGPRVPGAALTIRDSSLMGTGTFQTTSPVRHWGGAVGYLAYTDYGRGPYDPAGTLTLINVGIRTPFSVGSDGNPLIGQDVNCLVGIDPVYYPGAAVTITSSAARGFSIGGVATDCGGRWDEVAASTVALMCEPDPVEVGGTVTCTVSGADADFDFIWEAGEGASARRGVVTTDARGRGTFTFVALRDELGRFIGVELVAWGITSGVNVVGRTPGAIPAGSGPAWPAVALAASLLGAVLAVPLVRRRRTGAAG